jgi:glycine cleavage system H lipoate-binding protein
MTAMFIGVLQTVGAFLGGLVMRLGVVLLVMAAFLVPVALVLGAVRVWRVLRPAARGLRRAGHVLYRPGVRYAAGHTWVEREANRVKVGVDGVVQEILPWALAVELPRPGQLLAEGEVAAVISCGNDVARIAAPIAGRVVAVNAEVERDPSLVKEDGYGRGWLFAIDPVDARWSTLPSGDLAREWMMQESDRLDRFLETRLGFAGMAARTGPAPQVLPTSDWRDLTRSFLHA